jgi:nitrite reductase/ring-hydroxylating ferredoxin subunit
MEPIEIAASTALPEGGALRFRIPREGALVEAFVVRRGGEIFAYVNRCTHREVELDLGSGTFLHPDGTVLRCRAHGALFDVRSGACVGGICPKPSALARVQVEERAGRIFATPG